jgi:hypothetical protein
MKMKTRTAHTSLGSGRTAAAAGTVVAVAVLLACQAALGNGGPFVVKYPTGDPAAKGILARLDPGLMPMREERLEVVRENLSIVFDQGDLRAKGKKSFPLVHVEAEYRIKNPTDEGIDVDFGFPILRGIYVDRHSMLPRPQVHVSVDGRHCEARIISNSAIYGVVRRRARACIDKAVQADKKLIKLVAGIAGSTGAEREAVRKSLADYLTGALKWDGRDAALMVEYAGIDFGKAPRVTPGGQPLFWQRDNDLRSIARENLSILGAIGEQKATQFFAQLASRFDPDAGSGYEAVFGAWGGDVRERSVDLRTGKVRPREVSTEKLASAGSPGLTTLPDPTVYARVDYLDSNAKLSEAEKEACKAVLRNLPVIFTFAPMNLLHYRVGFTPLAEQTVTVRYSQYAYLDTAAPASYQLAYVVHPASLWDRFGPINLRVEAPKEARLAASVPFETVGAELKKVMRRKVEYSLYTATITDKTGELYVGIDADGWHAATRGKGDRKKLAAR